MVICDRNSRQRSIATSRQSRASGAMLVITIWTPLIEPMRSSMWPGWSGTGLLAGERGGEISVPGGGQGERDAALLPVDVRAPPVHELPHPHLGWPGLVWIWLQGLRVPVCGQTFRDRQSPAVERAANEQVVRHAVASSAAPAGRTRSRARTTTRGAVCASGR